MNIVLKKFVGTFIVYLVTGIALALFLAIVRSSLGEPFAEAAQDNLKIFFTFDYGGIAEQIAASRWLILLNSTKLTFMLIFGANAFIVICGVTSGIFRALFPENLLLKTWNRFLSIMSSFPALVAGILVIFLCSRFIDIVPFYDLKESGNWVQWLAIYTLPMITLAIGDGALADVMGQTEQATRQLLRSDYMRAIQARGVPVKAHVIRGLALSVTASLSSKGAYFVSGAVVVEYLFGWQGLGFQMIDTMATDGAKDFRLILAATLIFISFVILFTFITDLIKYFSDPRSRVQI